VTVPDTLESKVAGVEGVDAEEEQEVSGSGGAHGERHRHDLAAVAWARCSHGHSKHERDGVRARRAGVAVQARRPKRALCAEVMA